MRPSRLRASCAATWLVLAGAGCTFTLEPGDDLRVYYSPMDRDLPGEVNWPERPNVFGGRTVLIRGAMVSPCGAVVSRAALVGRTVTVQITSVDDSRSCAAARFLQPFEAEVTGLPAGAYRIRTVITSVAAHDDVEAVVTAP